MILNSSLASGLGRPDLTFRVSNAGAIQTGYPAHAATMVEANGGTGSALVARAPGIGLMVLIGGVAAFAYWVRPYLA